MKLTARNNNYSIVGWFDRLGMMFNVELRGCKGGIIKRRQQQPSIKFYHHLNGERFKIGKFSSFPFPRSS